jgi:predicted DsbA family dithiol-disulfide isomerase
VKTLDFYFDYACPWCYVGSKTVEKLKAHGVQVGYHVWKMPENASPPPKPDGYYEAARARLKQLREELGLPLSSPVQKETIPALRATKIADDMGAAEAFIAAVFTAHWSDKKDISNSAVLVDLAVSVGLDRETFAERLAADSGNEAFQADLRTASEQNIDTIPSYLSGDKRLLVHHFEDMPTLEALLKLVH